MLFDPLFLHNIFRGHVSSAPITLLRIRNVFLCTESTLFHLHFCSQVLIFSKSLLSDFFNFNIYLWILDQNELCLPLNEFCLPLFHSLNLHKSLLNKRILICFQRRMFPGYLQLSNHINSVS